MIINDLKAAFIGGLVLFVLTAEVEAQTTQTKATLYEGIIVTGYADHGAYLNFAGPALKYSRKPFILMLGLLPSLKIKKDNVLNNATRNAVLTPTLGFGLTTVYKHLALQVPCYYSSKTSAVNGKWNIGFGAGYKF